MLFISFIIIFTLKKTGDALKNRYDKKDCPVDWYAKYTEGGAGLESKQNNYEDWYKVAEAANLVIRKDLIKNPAKIFPNTLHCFCTFDMKANAKTYKEMERKL